MADIVPEREKQSVGDTWGGAEALVDALADTLTDLEALTTGETLGDAYALNDLLGDTWQDIGQCAVNCRHAG